MKKTFTKIMLLLFALVVGISNVWADEYKLYSGTITEGDYVIVYDGKAMKNTISSNRLTYAEVTPSNNKITDPSAAIVWHIEANGDYWTIYNANVSKYAASTGSNNQAKLEANVTNNSKWTITGTSTYEFENLARANASSNNKWLRNNGTYGFACYTSGIGGALSLYKKETFTVTATVNNASMGSVSVNGTTITAAPNTGYRVRSGIEGYTVTMGTATVTHEGTSNTLTVSPSTNCTVQVNFEAIPTHTATFSINGNTSQTASVAEGASITFPSNISPVYGKPFMGWVSAAIDGTTDEEPEFVTSATMSTDDVTFYAVFATATAGDPVETKTQTLQYDSWSYKGTTSDQSSYRLFGNNSYVESESFDLSKLTKVKVYGGTYGGESTYNTLTIGDGTNTWKDVTITGKDATKEHEYTGGTTLSGTKKLRVISTCGNGSSSGIRMTKVEIYTNEPSISYSAYCTTVPAPAVIAPEITVAETFFFSTTVSISCETVGANIKYSYDSETWDDYTEPFNITTTKTIYAKAVKDEVESTVAQATATKQLAEPTVSIITSDITNKNVYSGTAAGSLSATVKYNDETIGGVTWSGDANAVATINSTTGVVTLVAAGSVTFTATYAGNTDYSSKTATYTMNVINYDPSLPTYTLVANVSDIVPGAHYVIASSKAEGTAYAMSSQNAGSYRNIEEISVIQFDKDNDESDDIFISSDDVYEFVISGDKDNCWTIYDEGQATNHYLAATGTTSSNYLSVISSVEGRSKWSISINPTTTEATIVAQITGGDEARNNLRYNNNSGQERFSCYKEASTCVKVFIYKKDNDTDIHPYSTTTYSSGSVTINDAITLSENYNITVGAGAIVTFTSTPNCSDASWLVVKEGGQLIIPSSGSKTDVKATFQKEITAYTEEEGKDNYYLIANPTTDVIDPEDVAGMVKDDVDDEDEFDYDLYYFDEAQPKAEWRNYRQVAFNLVKGKGYLYAKSSDITLEFPGTVLPGTTADITLSRLGSGAYAGFNLVGNPLSNNVTTMKIAKGLEESSCSYYKVNSDNGVFAVSTAPITVGEAFMVQAPNDWDGATLTLNPVAKGEDGFNNEVIRLEVSNSKFTDVAYVYFGNHLPLTKINHLNDEAPMLYIHNENSDRAVEVYNNRGEVKSINVNFEAKTMGTYTISAKMVKGEIKYMHLYDRLTGIDTDLLVDDYSFIGTKDDQSGRFILNLESVDDNGSSTGSETFAYQSGDNIIVNGEGELQVFDVTGRMVMSQRVNGAQIVNGLNTGVYVFRMEGKVQKVVIR